MHCRSKRQSPHLRASCSTAYLPHPAKLPFRTLLKRRNQTIAASQLYQQPPSRPQKHLSRQLSQSQLATPPAPPTPRTPLPIKDFVKTMGKSATQKHLKPEQPHQQPAKVDQQAERPKSGRSSFSSSRPLTREPKEVLEPAEPKSLEEVERRVEALIIETISQFRRERTPMGASQLVRSEGARFKEKDVEEVIGWVKDLAQRQEGNAERLEDLNRKLLLIEKLLAHGTVEGELMQGAYFNWKSQRANTSSFSKHPLRSSTKYNQPQPHLHHEAPKSGKVVARYDSTSKAAFQKPPKDFYLLGKDKRSSFSANRQPMQRSSYACQFLNYGHLVPYSYKPSSVGPHPEVSLAVTASTYQQEYKEKLGLTTTVSFKELDCYRDKFHRSDICFTHSSKKPPPAKVAKHSKENLDASTIKKSQESLLGCTNMSNSVLLRTEHQKEYYWHNTLTTETAEPAQIKDGRLDKLKESFRALARRK